jgi:hypothetical protein
VQNLNQKTPGPGTYDLIPEISPSGNYFLSKYRSPKAPQFNPPHSKRFQDICRIFVDNIILAREVKEKPGPGQYPVFPSLTKTGVYFLSKYKSSLCRKFGARINTPSTAGMYSFNTPGPGSYAIPSDFGSSQLVPSCSISNFSKRGNGSRTATKSKGRIGNESPMSISKDLTEPNKLKESNSVAQITREIKTSQN